VTKVTSNIRSKIEYFLVIEFCISRCLFVAHSYLLGKKWREAVSLYDRVLSHATSAVTHFQEINSHPQVCLFVCLLFLFSLVVQCFVLSTLGNPVVFLALYIRQ